VEMVCSGKVFLEELEKNARVETSLLRGGLNQMIFLGWFFLLGSRCEM